MRFSDYNPKDASSALPPGEYDASIKSTTEQDKDGNQLISKKSREPMQLVTFEVYQNDGPTRQVRQYFTNKSMLFLYRKLAHALGQEAAFSDGKFNAMDHLGANLILELDIESNSFGEQNVIKEFLPKKGGVAPVAAKSGYAGARETPKPSTGGHTPITEADIPFS